MPYENERANRVGYSSLLEDPWVRERLNTFAPLEGAVKGDFSDLPVKNANELKRSHPKINKLVAIDGSVSITESFIYGFQVGAIKLAVVTEDTLKHEQLKKSTFIDPRLMNEVYLTEAFTGLLPGRGIGHKDSPANRTWHDKFRLELFHTFKHFIIPQTDKSLLTSLKSVMNFKTVSCGSCRLEGKGAPPLKLPEGRDYISCPSCGKGVYITDGLFLDSELTYLDNGGVILSAMNLLERFMMAGLLETATPEARKTTAFITDGPLAFFSSDSEINNKLLYHIQRQKPQPLLFGLEKTGVANSFAEIPEVREKLLPGHFAMITEGIANLMLGKGSSRKGSYSYGKRFLYRSLRGDKVFVVMVPPRVGVPYQKFDFRSDDWDTYPTLGSISDVIESQQTDQFGLTTAALGVVAQVNHGASLPKVLSEVILTELVQEVVKRPRA